MDYLVRRAQEIHNALLPDILAFKDRTVAVLRVKHFDGTCTDIIGGGTEDIVPRQRALFRSWPIEDEARDRGKHAEVKVLEHMRTLPLIYDKPVALGSSNIICPNCQKFIRDWGPPGFLISSRGAIWR